MEIIHISECKYLYKNRCYQMCFDIKDNNKTFWINSYVSSNLVSDEDGWGFGDNIDINKVVEKLKNETMEIIKKQTHLTNLDILFTHEGANITEMKK